jgi:hypothetical protein
VGFEVGDASDPAERLRMLLERLEALAQSLSPEPGATLN